MNERDEEIEKAAREMGDLSWQYFADEAARPTTLWRLLTVRTWKKRQVPMSEWFDDEAKVKDRLAHHAANDKVETIGFDRYVLCAELAALRQQLAEVNKNWQDAEAHIKLCNKIHAERCRLHDEANEQLSAQAAELERLREAAEKSVAAFEHYQMTCREHRSPYIKENGRRGASPYAELVESCQDIRAALSPSDKENNS